MTELILHLMAFKGTTTASIFLDRVSFIKTSMQMLHSMCTRSLILLGMKVLLPAHCTDDLILLGYVRLIMQKNTICTGQVEQIQHFLITFWTCQALVEDNTCASLANRHMKLLPAWKSQIRAAVEQLQLSKCKPQKSY